MFQRLLYDSSKYTTRLRSWFPPRLSLLFRSVYCSASQGKCELEPSEVLTLKPRTKYTSSTYPHLFYCQRKRCFCSRLIPSLVPLMSLKLFQILLSTSLLALLPQARIDPSILEQKLTSNKNSL